MAFWYAAAVIGALKTVVTADNSFKEKKMDLRTIVTDDHFQDVLHKMNVRNDTLPRRILFTTMKHKLCKIFIC